MILKLHVWYLLLADVICVDITKSNNRWMKKKTAIYYLSYNFEEKYINENGKQVENTTYYWLKILKLQMKLHS